MTRMVPQGWRSRTIGELGRYLNGRGFKKSEWSETGRPIIRIQNLTGSSEAFNYFQGEVEDRYVARPGDLLVSWAATLGAYFWNGPEAVVNQHIFKVESTIDRRFHKYLLDYKLADLMRHTHGSGMVHITRGRFDSEPVLVPESLTEQQGIVEILEDHLSRLDAAEANVESATRRKLAFGKSVLKHLIWDEELSVTTVAEVLREPMRNGRSDRASDASDAVRTLTLTAVTRRDFSETNTKMTSTTKKAAEGLWLEPGDVFVQRSNTPELVGTTARYDGPREWAIFPDLLIRLRPDETKMDSRYLAAALRSERAHRSLRDRAKGLAGSMPKIDQGALGATVIPIPSIERQKVALAELDHLEYVQSRIDAAATSALARSAALRRAVLSAAFEGKLTGRHTDQEVIEELAAV